MNVPLHERPSVPLTWGEQDRFARLADLRASWRAAFWPAVVCSGFLVALALLWATRGVYVDWTGFHPIPTGGTR